MSKAADNQTKEVQPASIARAARRARTKQNPDAAESQAPAAKAAKVRNYELGNSDDMEKLSKELAKFIKDNKLSTQIQGKEFVNVEAWVYAGSRCGIVPIVEHTINLSNEQELKYQSKVYIFDLRLQITVGAGFAICSNKESGKKFYQEFAISSMSQTRAIGKAFRNLLAWVVRAAGYEATPAEEMEYSGNMPNPTQQEQPIMRAVTVGPKPPTPIGSYSTEPSQEESVPHAATAGGLQDTPAVPVQYATASQKEEIIRLLNHPLITRQEKTKMLLNINRLDEERATAAIAKLRKAIEDREGTTAVSA